LVSTLSAFAVLVADIHGLLVAALLRVPAGEQLERGCPPVRGATRRGPGSILLSAPARRLLVDQVEGRFRDGVSVPVSCASATREAKSGSEAIQSYTERHDGMPS
jgi:hypothetical protein